MYVLKSPGNKSKLWMSLIKIDVTMKEKKWLCDYMLTPSWKMFCNSWYELVMIRDAVFRLFPTFRLFPPLFFPLLFFPSFFVHVYCMCITTMRVNWWLSGQFWLRKRSSFKGASPTWTPTRALPLDPDGGYAPRPPITWYFPTFLNSPSGIPVSFFNSKMIVCRNQG